ncbi:AlpA family transcriptional regulator [Burkholderia plantarii]|uniref:helix-turn-helix transcriptional regulator n=1 Tax=Burkholderia plantarii TaxID=41899 RepID=UPI00272B281A|nr:AlpA family transcriptional regulator [Burkholderia plantarii]WLE60308.1 AlpA family transcriptional regulator [Burkholderia plantarii]
MNVLRIAHVAEKVGLGKSTLYRMIAAGEFPKPIKITSDCNGWLDEDIDQWLAERAGRHQAALAINTAPAVAALSLDGENLAELARQIAQQLAPYALWDLSEVAKYLHRSEQHTRQWVITQDGFPRPLRIPSGKSATERARPLWRAKDVIAWAESHVES